MTPSSKCMVCTCVFCQRITPKIKALKLQFLPTYQTPIGDNIYVVQFQKAALYFSVFIFFALLRFSFSFFFFLSF